MAQEEHRSRIFLSPQDDESGDQDSANYRCLPEFMMTFLGAPSALSRSIQNNILASRLLFQRGLLIIGCCMLLGGCRARLQASSPSIEFTRIPPAEVSRTDKLDIIQGRVIGA